ncbi:peptidase M18, aminopeptidase I [Nadsonia fulvescens var. elongata DSM 6958]|uniref:Peptidase M18, aminopeptidase I n=1 Tax=Nadsonia fulvescens var. elongata DSM 6958 TaxID=857566 RepID=A0A1E3PTR3_9ASCO|nr:peptidase M18, aminopeptidase I [Nadsonia fulvescens var. elongata DSM 6958]
MHNSVLFSQAKAQRKTPSSASSSSPVIPSKIPYEPSKSQKEFAESFLKFMNTCPTVFHTIEFFAAQLESAGFVYLSERESWDHKLNSSNNKYYTTRNGSSLAAFICGEEWSPGKGIGLVGTHGDAITQRLKPTSKKDDKDGFKLLGVSPYSSATKNTWWDRDLSIAGRVIVQDGNRKISRLVDFKDPIGHIPTLAPHFGTPAQGPFNPETQMTPIIGLSNGSKTPEPTLSEMKSPLIDKHDIKILRRIADELNIEVKDIMQVELELYDCQGGNLGGLDQEFVFCPRLDDKLCSFAALYGLIEHSNEKKGHGSGVINMHVVFDNEEIGSLTRQGARGGLFQSTVDRILESYHTGIESSDELKRQTLANSFFVSSDVTHAVNPNFSSVYLEGHKPKLNTGLTVKLDPNGHTTSDAVSTCLVEEIARRTQNTLQYFHIRNDSRSGSTIGPALSSATGMRAVDAGIPQLSMHSIRATTGSSDVWLGVKFYKAFWGEWEAVDQEFKEGDL